MIWMSENQRYGLRAEKWVLGLFEERNYEARLTSTWTDRLDIVVNGVMPVEVRIRRQYMRTVRTGYYRPSWMFKANYASLPFFVAKKDMLFVLICEDEAKKWHPFFIPSWEIGSRRCVSITSHPEKYAGRWADFRGDWSQVDIVLESCQRAANQLELWPGLNFSSYQSRERILA